MSFRKKQIKQKPHPITSFTGIIGITVIFLTAVLIIQNVKLLSFDLEKKPLPTKNTSTGVIQSGNNTQLITSAEKEKINLLIVGRGGGNHDAPNLTDTIILASIHKGKKVISLLSIPRDLYVTYPDGQPGKINEIYALFSKKLKSKAKGMELLGDKITEITGESIDYYANIDFEGFKKVIDTIGGVDITLEKSFTDNQFPDGNLGYRTFTLKKGTWTLDGEVALNYARSRHSTSDFDRAMRQQQIIQAVQDKISASYFIKSPTKIKEFYNIFKEYVFTDLSLSDILKLSYLIKETKDYSRLSYNINDTCFYGSETCDTGGILYVPEREYFDGRSVLLIEGTNKFNLDSYQLSQDFSSTLFNSPEFFIQDAQVNIFNSLKVNHLAGTMSNDVIRYGFQVPKIGGIGNTPTVYNESVIYYNNLPSDSAQIKALKKYFTGEFIQVNTPKYSKDSNTKIEIIIGKDYKKAYNF